MPSQSRKHRGYDTQRIVCRKFQATHWPHAEPVGAGRPGSDLTGVPGLDIEIFARRDGLSVLTAKLAQSASRADGNPSLIVMRPDGWGEARIDAWPAIMPLADILTILNLAGYGTDTP